MNTTTEKLAEARREAVALQRSLDSLDRRELATVLAALRLWQMQQCVLPRLHVIATDGDQVNPLDDSEIDALCERLNQ